MVPAHAGLEHGRALSQPWVSHHEGSETYGVTVPRPITGRTSGRPIRTPPPAAPPLACGITLGRSLVGRPKQESAASTSDVQDAFSAIWDPRGSVTRRRAPTGDLTDGGLLGHD